MLQRNRTVTGCLTNKLSVKLTGRFEWLDENSHPKFSHLFASCEIWLIWTTTARRMQNLLGAKPLPEPVPTYCHLDNWERILMKLESRYKTFHSWKCVSAKWRPFSPGGDEFECNYKAYHYRHHALYLFMKAWALERKCPPVYGRHSQLFCFFIKILAFLFHC